MEFSTWIPLLLIFAALYAMREQTRNIVLRKIRKNKRGNAKMTELIKNYIGKDCIIYTCTPSSQITGTIISCQDGWLQVEKNGQTDIINSEYIIRIREYPTNKKGKKRSIITG